MGYAEFSRFAKGRVVTATGRDDGDDGDDRRVRELWEWVVVEAGVVAPLTEAEARCRRHDHSGSVAERLKAVGSLHQHDADVASAVISAEQFDRAIKEGSGRQREV